MKEYEIKKVEVCKRMIKEAHCDRCGEECTNCHSDIFMKATYSDKYDLLETICWKCLSKYIEEADIRKKLFEVAKKPDVKEN